MVIVYMLMSELGSIQALGYVKSIPTAACEDNPTIVEVDDSLFWLQSIVCKPY